MNRDGGVVLYFFDQYTYLTMGKTHSNTIVYEARFRMNVRYFWYQSGAEGS